MTHEFQKYVDPQLNEIELILKISTYIYMFVVARNITFHLLQTCCAALAEIVCSNFILMINYAFHSQSLSSSFHRCVYYVSCNTTSHQYSYIFVLYSTRSIQITTALSAQSSMILSFLLLLFQFTLM